MPRTRTFDRQEVLEKILPLFREKGYRQTSLGDILKATGIARQSLYNTYGDKRRLFLEAFSVYRERLIRDTESRMRREMESGRPIPDILRWMVYSSDGDIGVGGGLAANIMAGFHEDDDEVQAEVDRVFAFLRKTLRKLLRLGQERGEVTKALLAEKMAEVLLNAGIGLRIGRENRLDAKKLADTGEWTVDLVCVKGKG